MNLKTKANQLRAMVIQMAHNAGVGHVGSALSCIDMLVALYYGWLHVDPANPKDENRDRFILSKGHAASALYAVLADRGFIPVNELKSYGIRGSRLREHPCKNALPILECSTGSLGHGLGIGTGMAHALKLARSKSRVVVMLSDGECNEGSTWESAMYAASKNLDNLVVLVDENGWQAVGESRDIMGRKTDIQDKFRFFGWHSETTTGHDIEWLQETLNSINYDRPSCIACRTVKGRGISFMENNNLWHYRVPTKYDLVMSLEELKENPIHI